MRWRFLMFMLHVTFVLLRIVALRHFGHDPQLDRHLKSRPSWPPTSTCVSTCVYERASVISPFLSRTMWALGWELGWKILAKEMTGWSGGAIRNGEGDSQVFSLIPDWVHIHVQDPLLETTFRTHFWNPGLGIFWLPRWWRMEDALRSSPCYTWSRTEGRNSRSYLAVLLFMFRGSVVSDSLWPPWTAACQASFPVLHHLPELAQTHVHWVGDAIQPSHPLLSPSPPAFNLSQRQVAKVLELQLQHQSFQWIVRADFL